MSRAFISPALRVKHGIGLDIYSLSFSFQGAETRDQRPEARGER